jgi:hypothetical protein
LSRNSLAYLAASAFEVFSKLIRKSDGFTMVSFTGARLTRKMQTPVEQALLMPGASGHRRPADLFAQGI